MSAFRAPPEPEGRADIGINIVFVNVCARKTWLSMNEEIMRAPQGVAKRAPPSSRLPQPPRGCKKMWSIPFRRVLWFISQ